jgi:anti-anti-sigma factor
MHGSGADQPQPVGLLIAPEVTGDWIRLRLSGYVDLSNAHELGRAVDEALERGDHVELDLSELSFADSTGLREFVLGYHHAQEAGHGYRVTGARGAVRQVLELAGMLDFLSTGVPAAG